MSVLFGACMALACLTPVYRDADMRGQRVTTTVRTKVFWQAFGLAIVLGAAIPPLVDTALH